MIFRNEYWNISLLLFIVILTGCTSQEKMNDTTGSLGRENSNSPARIYVEMGMAYMRDGQSAVALKKLKKAIEVDSDYPDAQNVIAIIYEQLGERDLAGKHFDKAVKLDGQDPYIRNARGSYLCRQGNFEKANADFQKALSNPLYPTPWVALTNAGLCIERTGGKAKAENFYRKALTANPKYATALYQMAVLLLEQEKYLSARAYLERYHGVAQPTAASLWLGVQIEKQLKGFAKANDYKKQLLKDFPDSPEIQKLYKVEKSQ